MAAATITIYDGAGAPRYATPINVGSKRVCKLMGDDYITLVFSTAAPVYFALGDYCVTDFGRFELCEPYQPAYNKATGGYDYELKLEAQYCKWRNKIMRFLPDAGGSETAWAVTLRPADHLRQIVRNVNALALNRDADGNVESHNTGYLYNGTDLWSEDVVVDASVEGGAKTVTYDSTNIFDALGAIAEAYECEWWIEANVIHLGKCELTADTYKDLELGVNVADMTRSDSRENYVTRVLAFGGERNISPRYRKVLVFTVTAVKDTSNTDNGTASRLITDDVRPLQCAWFKDAAKGDTDGVTITAGPADGCQSAAGVRIQHINAQGNVVPFFESVTDATTGQTTTRVLDYVTATFNPGHALKLGDRNWLRLDGAHTLEVGDRFIITNIVPSKVKSSYFTSKYLAYDAYSDVAQHGVVTRRLMLPEGTNWVDYTDNQRQEQGVEDVVVFEDVYPKAVCTVTEVREVQRNEEIQNDDGTVSDRSFTAYQIKDDFFTAARPFSTDYIIAGKNLEAVFQDGRRYAKDDDDYPLPQGAAYGDLIYPVSGKLNGWTFQVNFTRDDDGSAVWELVRDNDAYVPNEYIRPEVGDQFVLTNFDIEAVDELYVPKAEEELLKMTRKYVAKQNIDPSTYTCTLMPDAVLSPVNPQGMTLQMGSRVNLLNEAYLPVSVDDEGRRWGRKSRVIGYEFPLDIPWDNPQYTIGEKAQYSRFGEIEDKIDDLKFTFAGENVFGGASGSASHSTYLITQGDPTPASDTNTFSALRSLLEFASKRVKETIGSVWTFAKGLQVGDYGKGYKGAAIDEQGDAEVGRALIRGEAVTHSGYTVGDFQPGAFGGRFWEDDYGKVHLETDYVEVRAKLHATEVEIQEETHVGGCQIISPAAMRCSRVEAVKSSGAITAYRCYFTAKDDEGAKVYNQFVVNDLARCETFNLEQGADGSFGNRYYWRRVLECGTAADGSEHYITLGNDAADKDGDCDAPQEGDRIITVGNTTEKQRQNLIMLASYGTGSPFIYQYQGIDTFSLNRDNLKTAISPDGNIFTGRFIIEDKGVEQPLAEYITDNAMQFVIEPSSPVVYADTEGNCTPAQLSCKVWLVTGNTSRVEVPLANDPSLATYAAGDNLLLLGGSLLASAPAEVTMPGEMLLRYQVTQTDDLQRPLRLYTGPLATDKDMERITFHLYRKGREIGSHTLVCQYDPAKLRAEYFAKFELTDKDITALAGRVTDNYDQIAQLKITAEDIRTEVNQKIHDSEGRVTQQYRSYIQQTARQLSLKVKELAGVENLIKNYTDGTGWKITDPATATLVDARPTSEGLYEVRNALTSARHLRTPGFVLLGGGTTYTLSWAHDCDDFSASCKAVVVDDRGTILAQGDMVQGALSLADPWQHSVLTFDTPSATDSVMAFVRFVHNGMVLGSPSTLRIKDTMLEIGGTAHAFTPDKSGVLASGIDITGKKIVFTSGSFYFLNQKTGRTEMMIDEDGYILAEHIKADELQVNHLLAGEKPGMRVEITPDDAMQVFDSDDRRRAWYNGHTYPQGPGDLFTEAVKDTVGATAALQLSATNTATFAQGSYTLGLDETTQHDQCEISVFSDFFTLDKPSAVRIDAGSLNFNIKAGGFRDNNYIDGLRPSYNSEARGNVEVLLMTYTDDAQQTLLHTYNIYGCALDITATDNGTAQQQTDGTSPYITEAVRADNASTSDLSGRSGMAYLDGRASVRCRLCLRFSLTVIYTGTDETDPQELYDCRSKATVTWSGLTASYNNRFYVSNYFANGFCMGLYRDKYVSAWCRKDASGEDGDMVFEVCNGPEALRVSDNSVQLRHHNGLYLPVPKFICRFVLQYTSSGYFITDLTSWDGSQPTVGGSQPTVGVQIIAFPTPWHSLGLSTANALINVALLGDVATGYNVSNLTSSNMTLHFYKGANPANTSALITISML